MAGQACMGLWLYKKLVNKYQSTAFLTKAQLHKELKFNKSLEKKNLKKND